MPEPEHLRILEQGPKALKEWQEENPHAELLLNTADLSGTDLIRASLSRADLSKANLTVANFSGANLDVANLTGAGLASANLSSAELRWANLTGADLRGANLSRADLSYADFCMADLSEADLSYADLTHVSFIESDLSKSILRAANLVRAILNKSNFSSTNLQESNISYAKLINTNFENAFFDGANFFNIEIESSDFKYASIIGIQNCAVDTKNYLISKGAIFENKAYDDETQKLRNSLVITQLKLKTAEQVSKRLSSTTIPAIPIWQNRNFDIDENICFVIMPYKEEKNLQEVYTDHINKIIEGFGLNCIRADDIFKHQMIMENIWEHICTARFLISDLTDKNPNVFYELGMAHTIGKRVVLITQNDEDVPFDLRHLRYIKYEFTPPGMKKFENELTKAIDSIMKATKK